MSNTWNRFKRTLTWMLATALVFSSVPAVAFGAEPVSAPAANEQTVTDDAEVTEVTPATAENGGGREPF